MKAKLYTLKAEAKPDFSLPKEYVKTSAMSLLAQAVRVYEDRTHFGLSRVKTRSEVNISKKKIYKQKGTGGARHGAKSAHIFVGGGVVHGPTGMKRDLKMPINMKKRALLVALSNKFASGKAVLVEGINKITKTSEASKALMSIKGKLEVKSKVLVVLANSDAKIFRFFKNIKNVDVVKFSDLNAFLVLKKSLILIDREAFKS
ncbi:MAG: 50S ribosomal protein L4 [Patescibacteria group bacterium]